MGTESNIKSITPGPRILIAIARTAITPINALCELIDNSIDGFINAERLGHKIENPTITITIPSKQDIDSGVGALIIEDNGPGMDADTAINAVTAGYSGQDNPRDNLGLFGMGFNISSGKLGRTTILKSARKEDKTGSKITINLPDLVKTGSFEVPEDKFEKPNPNYSGTIIQIQDWWPQGDPNYNFIIKLATTNKNSIREQIGRIYSTKIRDGLSIIIADKPVEPFEHCRWLENRFVLNNGEKIPAYFKVDEVIGRELRCTNCFELVTNNSEKCPTCDNTSFKEFKNRIYGWLGIQRIAHSTNYGIDLIRNGRLIRQWEKEAFFEWKNPDNPEESIKDYPIDPGYYLGGRIIGEVHLDFVPVDFLKTNFQQTSLAWLDAISFLRGTTSLQPARAAGKNSSIIYKLFQGYRRIEGGPRFLYPGYWSMKDGAHTFKPLSKDDAEEFYEKFKNNEAGYGPDDDSKWFEMVEKAQERPDTGMKKCPNPECLMDNPEDDETCFNCGFIFNKKQCISCKQDIPFSAERCGLCGADQDENSSKWTCQICLKENNNDSSECSSCGSLKGTINTLSLEYLVSHSQIIKELSIDNAFIKLPDDAFSSPLNIEVRSLNSEGKHLILKNKRLPIFVDRTAEKITVIVDHEHPAFVKFQDRIEDYVAIEIANSIKQRLTSSPNKEDLQLWNLANIYYLIQSTLWPDQIEFDPQVLKEEVKSFFNDLSSAMPKLMQGVGRDIYNSLDKKSQAKLAMEIAKNTDLGKLDELIDKNLIFNYFDNGMILQLIKDNPNYFFDNKYWQDSYISIDMGDDEINSQIRKSILAKYINCLENLTIYLDLRNPSPIDAKRAELALLLAKQKINN